jgi:hypothetical protein
VEYTSGSITVTAEQYDGSDASKTAIQKLVGQANANAGANFIQVKNLDGIWTTIYQNWWAAKFSDSEIAIFSEEAFKRSEFTPKV